jgi:hypothetical protein
MGNKIVASEDGGTIESRTEIDRLGKDGGIAGPGNAIKSFVPPFIGEEWRRRRCGPFGRLFLREEIDAGGKR